MRPIFLCGFMGCGKSTVGRLLARRLKCRCTDLDDYIEKQERRNCHECRHGRIHRYGFPHLL